MSQPDSQATPALAGTPRALNVDVQLEYADRVNFAMQQYNVPLVARVAITNLGTETVPSLEVVISLDNGECEPWSGRVDRIEPAATFSVEPEGLRLAASRLASRTEAERANLRVEIVSPAGTASKSLPVDILAFDQWPGVGHYPELLAAFATPNHPKIAEILGAARSSLGALSGRDALDGYQSGSRQRAAHIAEACYNAVANLGIGYITLPASFERDGQRVRLVDRVLRERLGSCLDLSLLLASLWEQAGLHPLVLLLEGHAIPAVWTHNAYLPEPAIDEPARVRNLIELGEIVPLESTLTTQTGVPFHAAVESARRRMTTPGSGFCAIDIHASRKRRVLPLPLRDGQDHTEVDLDQVASAGDVPASQTTLDRVALADRVKQQNPRGAPAAAAAVESGSERIKRWQSRLLDLSLVNRLINFRQTGRTLRLNVPDIAALEDILADEGRVSLHPKTDGDEAFLRKELAARHVFTSETDGHTQKRLLVLFRTARAAIEETGANPLYLALGMLRWFETPQSETPRLAPLILLPVRLVRTAISAGYRYELALSEEPLRPNVTLLEKLRTEFGIDTGGLADLPEDERGLDVKLILRNFRAAIPEDSRWEVEESAYLGLFSFNKFLMWRDLQENMASLKQNRLVNHLVDRVAKEFDSDPLPRPDEMDTKVRPGELFCTRDADSTQLAAVYGASTGRTFVLEGPPGTGKSQTITNIIADSLARGKRVLFVAEKMAALNVVRRRLERDGLGPFCLELHSAKASKKQVLAQLESALKVPGLAEPTEWRPLCENLAETRDRLNEYARALHEKRDSGESLYSVLGRLAILGDGPRVALDGQRVASISQAELTAWRQRVSLLGQRSQTVNPPHEHPLRGVGRSQWTFGLVESARETLGGATAAIEKLSRGVAAFLTSVGVDGGVAELLGRGEVQAIVVAASLLPQCPLPSSALFAAAGTPDALAHLRSQIEIGKQRDATRAKLVEKYQVEFLRLDHLAQLDALSRASAKPGLVRWLSVRAAVSKLRPYCKVPKVDPVQLRADLEVALKLTRVSSGLSADKLATDAFGVRWNADAPNWTELEKQLLWSEQFRKAISPLDRTDHGRGIAQALSQLATHADRCEAAKPAASSLLGSWKLWTDAWAKAKQLLVTTGDTAFKGGTEAAWLPLVAQTFTLWMSGLPELNNWCAWRQARDGAHGDGLADLVERFETGELSREQLGSVFERSFGEIWLNAVANSLDVIRGFNAESQGSLIVQFRTADERMVELTKQTVAARVCSKAPNSSVQGSSQSEIGILRRELEKQKRHLPTRRLIEAMPNLLPRLKPCFLMSPLSVAQFLDTKLPRFDLVVFDEASQIPVWDAIGAIARGTEVIVVGDSKQLPPTTFFSTMDGEDAEESEDIAAEDMESILKESNASGIPAMWLSWHYRSRHESLIAFSNHYYYENRLHTFPSPDDRSPELGVTFRHVENGMYDKGGSRTNRVEATKVVDEIVRMLTASENPDSIGVVTFNQAQQSLIEDLLDQKRRERPEIEKFFTSEVPEPVFVKNLENVQGDERDSIIFSVGYGPDQTGKVGLNFGPLNQSGGERRLNVAITRARRKLVVFASLRSDQIDLRRTQALGMKHFKVFLDYADRGPRAIAEAVEQSGTGDFDSGFEHAVWKELVQRGWEVDTQVGCAGYRVDLAVRDPQRPGRYLLGVECDGASYHSAKSARDRDRLRQSVLEGLGWRIARVWSTAWRQNPAACLRSLDAAIEQARSAGSATDAPGRPGQGTKQPSKSRVREPDFNAPSGIGSPSPREARNHRARGDDPLPSEAVMKTPTSPALPVYVHARPSRNMHGLEIGDRATISVAIRALTEIVEAEGPIVDELALQRLASWFGVQRIRERFRELFDTARQSAIDSRAILATPQTLWPIRLQPESFSSVRVPGKHDDDRRELGLVPLCERVNAVLHVLEVQFGLPRDELEREAAALLGMMRVTAGGRELMGEAIDEALRTGHAVDRDGRISLAQ